IESMRHDIFEHAPAARDMADHAGYVRTDVERADRWIIDFDKAVDSDEKHGRHAEDIEAAEENLSDSDADVRQAHVKLSDPNTVTQDGAKNDVNHDKDQSADGDRPD